MKKLFNSFRLFKKVYLSTRREIGASLIVLFITTLFFAVVMWIAESRANSDYSISNALVWVITKYVEDPADITTAPVTILGQVVGTLVGILGIAIFAVPAGLLGSGLIDAINDEKRDETIAKNSDKLHKRFRRIAQTSSWFYNEKGNKINLKYVPRFRSFEHIIVKTGMTNDDIIDTVSYCPDMRLMNLATTRSIPGKDELVVVSFPLNREYGCCIDRGADVTIVAPVAVTEIGTGNFAYSLAAMGGFNYVSKEITPNPDDPFGFYTMRKDKLSLIGDNDMKEDVESQALHFMDDLKQLKQKSEAAGRRHWFIFLMGTTKTSEQQVLLWRFASNSKDRPKIEIDDKVYGSTVVADDEAKLQALFSDIKDRLAGHTIEVNNSTQPIAVSLDNNNVLKSVLSSNIMCRMGGGIDCNALTLRVGYEILIYSNRQLLIVRDIANAIKEVVEPDREVDAKTQRCFLAEGDGYADNYGESVEFESDPAKLHKMIEEGCREARQRFERYDLDGNIEPIVKKSWLERLRGLIR